MPFKKGDPNINRKGRPIGGVSIVDAIKRKLEEVEPTDRKSYLDLIIQKIFQKALEDGDVTMLRDMINRVDGLPTQTIAHSGDLLTGLTEEQKEKLSKILDLPYDKQGSLEGSDRGNTTGEDISL